jgi:hypothetical protein
VCGPEVVELGKGDAGKTGTASFVCKNKNKTCVAVRSASHRALNNPRAEQADRGEERSGERNCAGTGKSRYHHACAFSLPPPSIQQHFVLCVPTCFIYPPFLCFTRPDQSSCRGRERHAGAGPCLLSNTVSTRSSPARICKYSSTLSTTFLPSSLLVVPNLKSYYIYIYIYCTCSRIR